MGLPTGLNRVGIEHTRESIGGREGMRPTLPSHQCRGVTEELVNALSVSAPQEHLDGVCPVTSGHTMR